MTQPVYIATINVPGYLPESDPFYSHRPGECWRYLADERIRGEDDAADDGSEDYSDTVSDLTQRARLASNAPMASCATGTLYGATPGYEGDHDLGLAYSVDTTSDVRWDTESGTWVEAKYE